MESNDMETVLHATTSELESDIVGADLSVSQWEGKIQGWPGSVNDSRLLRNSGFYRMCEGGERLNEHPVAISSLNMREYIIGDGGYLLLPWLITPFSGGLTTSQTKFNFKLSSTRIVVERAFGRLKKMWQILESKQWHPNLEVLPKTIFCCCTLHDMTLDVVQEEDDTYDDVFVENGTNVATNELTDPVARLVREELMNFVNGDMNDVSM
ncbi:hypothetical protein SUGI_0887950 [Cryptomeria japonica]|nr:hypothetical protein SUGI_0887950 [Cryptomeria japonica]